MIGNNTTKEDDTDLGYFIGIKGRIKCGNCARASLGCLRARSTGRPITVNTSICY